MISAVFVIGMIYFYNRTQHSDVVAHYKQSLSSDLQARYDTIVAERSRISYQGYGIGVILSLGIIAYYRWSKHRAIPTTGLVCMVLATSFVANYFYYMLSPKTDWMLNHIQGREHVKAWLLMYREMQYNYHTGLALGILAVGIFAFAFRC
ncbi:MAG: hypothetical protein ACOVRN_04635 [Flavobacterium sp.]